MNGNLLNMNDGYGIYMDKLLNFATFRQPYYTQYF